MTVKPNARSVHIKEQIIEDPASGLTLMFSAYPDREGEPPQCKLRICGDALPLGNRDFIFYDGELGATGTATGGICKTSWVREVVTDEERERQQAERERRVESWAKTERDRIRAEEDPNFEWSVEDGN